MSDDMHCARCKADTFSTQEETYLVYRWVVAEQRTVLVATYCSKHPPKG